MPLVKQSGKCVRLNQALLEDLRTIEIDEMVVSMNWGDCSGELFGLKGSDSIFFCHDLANLVMPNHRLLIGDVFVSLMKDLYAWKDHLEEVNKKVIINSARMGPIKRKREEESMPGLSGTTGYRKTAFINKLEGFGFGSNPC
ncbi:hypothetical protein BD560DRAFT_486554 [Blakeslea trispora]|nr:hypothetical protein BD560DRAFT_486554 [Blakeslea trispora]